jgi:hypothetical protein
MQKRRDVSRTDAAGTFRFMGQSLHRRSRHLATRVVAALLVMTVATTTATLASATTKSPREYVPVGAHVLVWSDPVFAVNGSLPHQITVTNLAVIARVRALINALPLSDDQHRVCPDDMMIPITLSFASSKGAAPFTRVVFQLGGCPSAEVFQNGSAVLPTLGGPTLSSTFATIRRLVDPSSPSAESAATSQSSSSIAT